jgi:hypothetical protein
VFISYAREDVAAARSIADRLESQGWSVWWDREIQVGSSFDDVIERELEAARCVVVLWSSHSIRSEWVRAEAAEGRARRILVPVLIEEIRPPLQFRQIQSIRLDATSSMLRSEAGTRLVGAIARILADSPAAARPESSVSDRSRPSGGGPSRIRRERRLPAIARSAGVLAIACAAGVSAWWASSMLFVERAEKPSEDATRPRESVAGEFQWTAEDRDRLASFKVDIYFDDSRGEDRALAERVSRLLAAAVPGIRVVVSRRQASFHEQIVRRAPFAVRFDAPEEQAAAGTLARLLNDGGGGAHFELEPVASGTERVLSILIFGVRRSGDR